MDGPESGEASDADVQAAFAATLVDEWVRGGVTDAVVAPGSRSTPLLVALAADGRLRLHVVLDERSAGFVALGLGLANGRPTPVVTTSGTASVELHPAIVEADLAGVPLLAVTTDRPPELHGVGAPQTVEQDGLFRDVTRWAVAPGVPDRPGMPSWRSLGARSVAATLDSPPGPGPVHLNLAFREPLLGDPAKVSLPPARPDGRPWHRVAHRSGLAADPVALARLVPVAELATFANRRGLVVAGEGSGDPEAVIALGRSLGWPVLADPRSGARLRCPEVVGAADALLRGAPVAGWTPEIVLRIGRPPASKVLGQWLATLPAATPQYLVDPYGDWADPDRRATEVLPCTPEALSATVVALVSSADTGSVKTGSSEAGPLDGRGAPGGSPWTAAWVDAERRAQAAIDAALADIGGDGMGEPGLARRLYAGLGEDTILVTSSSMPVRDVEWYGAPRTRLRVVANRGANGIDGVVSTAIGVALGGQPTVALIGDLAFAYDVSALLWASTREIDCTFVVVDNDGGGIFSFLPQASAVPAEQFERLWGTPHGLDLLALAAAYGASCRDLTGADDLDALLTVIGSGRGVRVARYRSDRATNVKIHDLLHAAVADAVAELQL
jgi:2-succinyl-5-enolpyruvyl-6-hydroxy-3-cyclohexene-1-carboxylate synthase